MPVLYRDAISGAISSSSLMEQYIFADTIGSGGFGKVKLATHVLTNEKVAIKIIDKHSIGEDLPRVQTELKALEGLSHQNICRLYQASETDDKFYFVLEYCQGGELFDYIVKKECLPEPEARHFFRQIVSAIAYVHNKGFAHRDLKPENLLLAEDLQLKLIDFGLCAKPESGLKNVLETCCGSPAYAAPELVMGKQYLGNEADIWSMGVLLYALLCGFLPFEDDNNIQNLYRKISLGKYQEPPWLSDGSKKLLSQMLQVDPKRRIRVEELMKHPWVVSDYTLPLKWRSIYDKNLVDEDCAKELGNYYDVDLKDMIERIKRWDYDYVTATYLLLLNRKKNRQSIDLPSPPRRRPSPKKALFTEPVPNILSSPTIHASLESGLDKCPDDGHFAFPAERKDRKLSKEDSYSRAVAQGVGRKEFKIDAPVTPVSKNVRRGRNEEKENVSAITPRDKDLVSHRSSVHHRRAQNQAIGEPPAPRPKSVYTTPGPHRVRHGPVLKDHQTTAQETPINASKRPHADPGSEKPDGRTPRSKSKTPGTTGKRRMFASVERKVDRVIHLLTPRRPKGDAPARIGLDRTKQTLVNVSTTSSADPHEVMAELLRVVGELDMSCEQNGWKLHGKVKDRATKMTFELEVVWVEHLKTVGIKRKRLNGDAFLYKRVCEGVLRLGNFGL